MGITIYQYKKRKKAKKKPQVFNERYCECGKRFIPTGDKESCPECLKGKGKGIKEKPIRYLASGVLGDDLVGHKQFCKPNGPNPRLLIC